MTPPFDLEALCTFGAHLPRALPPPPRAEAGPLGEAIEVAVADAIADAPAPFGLALSGGVDSTVVAAALAHVGIKPRAFVLDTGRAAAEAASVAAALGLELTRVPLPPAGVRAVSPLEVARALGQPTHSAAPFGFLLLYRAMAAAGVATVLTGDGADEGFAGHAYHRAPPAAWRDDIWSTWAEVRGLGVDTHDLLMERPSPWTESPAAHQAAAEARAITNSGERLRWLDVRLRQGPQCVDLQRALCTACGLAYRAPLADPRVTARALAHPVDPARPKWPLADLARAALGGPWRREKQPMHALTGLRPLGEAWLRWLNDDVTERWGLLRPAGIARALAAHDPRRPWLPRALVVAATTHAGLAEGLFERAQFADQFRGASSSK